MDTKHCSTCKLVKPFADFNKDKSRSDGYSIRCRACQREYMAQWRSNNRDNYNAYFRDYFSKHQASHAASVSKWQKNNRAKRNQQARARYHSDEQYRADQLARRKRQRSNNPKAHRDYAKTYRKHHPLEHRLAEAKRRARGNGAGYISKDHITKLLISQDGRCKYCAIELIVFHIDHVIPISRGGKHIESNIVLACPSCNMSKHDKLLTEWNP